MFSHQSAVWTRPRRILRVREDRRHPRKRTFARTLGWSAARDRRKVASAGGALYTYDPSTTTLSSTRRCGARAKKPLGERHHQHIWPAGQIVDAHRDRFSACLGLHGSLQRRIDALDLVGAQRAFEPRRNSLSVGTRASLAHVRRLGRRSVVRMLQLKGRDASAEGSGGGRRRESIRLRVQRVFPTASRYSERSETAERRHALGVGT